MECYSRLSLTKSALSSGTLSSHPFDRPPFSFRPSVSLPSPLPPTANTFSVSLETQKVVVWGPTLPPFEDITAKIAKTGKEIREKEDVKDQARLTQLVATVV